MQLKKEHWLIGAGILLALLALWALTRPAAAAPDCVPAYTMDPANDVGGQLASLSILPVMVFMAVPAAATEGDLATPGQQLRAICTMAAVTRHVVGAHAEPTDTR
jgi:hypothetical protein